MTNPQTLNNITLGIKNRNLSISITFDHPPICFQNQSPNGTDPKLDAPFAGALAAPPVHLAVFSSRWHPSLPPPSRCAECQMSNGQNKMKSVWIIPICHILLSHGENLGRVSLQSSGENRMGAHGGPGVYQPALYHVHPAEAERD